VIKEEKIRSKNNIEIEKNRRSCVLKVEHKVKW